MYVGDSWYVLETVRDAVKRFKKSQIAPLNAIITTIIIIIIIRYIRHHLSIALVCIN